MKELRRGEQTLKNAKETALDSSEEIQRLFAAIDEVAETARQTRLTLQRQIRERKQELKDLAIDEGVKEVRRTLAEQSLEFQQVDSARFLDRAHFAAAIKGKAGIKGVKKGIAEHVERVQRAIREKAELVADNAALLAGLPSEQQPMFQDRGLLLDKSREDLAAEIDRRLTLYRQEQERKARSLQPAGVVPTAPVDSPSTAEPVAEFEVTVRLRCTRSEAQGIARGIREHLHGVRAVTDIRLTAAPRDDG